MEIKTSDGSHSVTGQNQGTYNTIAGSLGLASFLGLNAANGGLFGGRIGSSSSTEYVTKAEFNMAQELAKKDSEIALLKSEQNTEIKIADVYERIMTRVNADQRAQAEWNASQSVANAQMSSQIAVNASSIAALQNCCNKLTKMVIPADNVCPKPMPMFNSWTAPTE